VSEDISWENAVRFSTLALLSLIVCVSAVAPLYAAEGAQSEHVYRIGVHVWTGCRTDQPVNEELR
jgi:hypothetical protein